MTNIAQIPVLSVMLLLAGAFAALLAGKLHKTLGNLVAFAASAGALALLLRLMEPVLLDSGILTSWLGGWTPRAHWAVGLSVQVDALGLFFALLVCGSAALSRLTALLEPRRAEAGESAGLSLALSAAALALVLSGDLSTIFVMMELMGLSAVALTACAHERPYALNAALNQLAVGAVTTSALLAGLCLTYSQFQSLNLAQIAALTPGEGENLVLTLAFGFLFTAFAARAMLFPFHVLSLEVQEALPPSGSLLIWGTLSKCGLYCVIRLIYMIFQNANHLPVSVLVTGFGAATLFLCALMTFRQRTLWRVLALHAAAQMGRSMALAGLCTALGLGAALYQSIHHTLTLSLLLLAAGLMERQTGTAELKKLRGLGCRMPATMFLFLVASLSLCGLPPFGGFSAQWLAVQALWERGVESQSIFFTVVLALFLLSGLLTVFSLCQTLARVFLGPLPEHLKSVREAPLYAQLPLWLLSAGTLLSGLYPRWIIDHILTPAVSAAANIPAYVDASFGEGFAWERAVPGGAVAWFPTADPWERTAFLIPAVTLLCAVLPLAVLLTARRRRLEISLRRSIRKVVKKSRLLSALFLLLRWFTDSRAFRALHNLWGGCAKAFRLAHSGVVNDACLYAVAALAFVLAVCLVAV